MLKSHRDEDVLLLATPELPWPSDIDGPRLLLLRWDGERALAQELPADPETLKAELAGEVRGVPRELFLVCTHGSRDPCCGLLGVPVHKRLAEISERSVIQSSHLGGHRFAPVIAAFPEWRFYGHVEMEQLEEFDQAMSHREPYLKGYRGSGRLEPELQLFEGALWQEHGAPVTEVDKLDQSDNILKVQARVGSENLIYQGEISYLSYRGYKSCKDFRKEKPSKLEIPILKNLQQLSLSKAEAVI